MKKQYLVCEDYTPGQVSHSDTGRVVKKFKHQNEAVSFIEDDKNIQQYNGLSLYMRDADDRMFRWNGRGWEVCSCG